MICSEISAGASWVSTVDSLRVRTKFDDQMKRSSRCFLWVSFHCKGFVHPRFVIIYSASSFKPV